VPRSLEREFLQIPVQKINEYRRYRKLLVGQASKRISLTGSSGSAVGNTLSGDNAATATNGITLSGASVTLNVGTRPSPAIPT